MAYEFDGEKYERASSHQREWGSRLIRELDLRGDEQILDMGCGDGAVTAQLALRVPRGSVVGIDASAGMIRAAQKRQAGNLRFVQKDINTLDYADRFDLIVSNATLHWLTDHGRMLARVHLALRENGVIRFSFAADGNCSRLLRVLHETLSSPAYRSRFDGFCWPWFMPTPKEYEELMQQSRFNDIRVWQEKADRFFPDAQAGSPVPAHRANQARQPSGLRPNDLPRAGAGIAGWFDQIVISGDLGFGKPDSRIFRETLSRLGASAGEAIMIGNSLHSDIRGAQQAGLRAVWVNRSGAAREDGIVPDGEVPDLRALTHIIPC
jgi:trans-aconitate methyltransferase